MANSWSNTFQSSLTLPTGATSGARIVLDGTNDEILVYNSAGQLVDTIGGPNGAITIGPAGGAQVILQQESGLGTIFFPTGNVHERTPAQINSGVVNQNTPTEFLAFTFTGASVTTATDFIRFQINTQAENGSSNANFAFVTHHANNTETAILSADDSQTNIFGALLVEGNAQYNGWINANSYITSGSEAKGIITLPAPPMGGGITTTTVTGLGLSAGPTNSGYGVVLTANSSVPGTDLKYVSYSNATSDGFIAHMDRTSQTATSVSYHIFGL